MSQAAKHMNPEAPLDILPMSFDHVERVLKIEQEAFPHPWKRDDFEYVLNKPNGYAVAAYKSNFLVGYALGFFVRQEFHLASLAIRGDMRRQSLGTFLLSSVVERVKDMGSQLITLEVRMSNAPAIALYEKAGFSQIAIREGYYSHPGEDAIVMLKRISEDPWP